MTKVKRKQILIITAVTVLLVIAYLCRIQRFGNVRGWVRCIIQCGLLIGWGVSIRKRIIVPKVRGYLLTIASLFGFWLLDRTVKYTVFKEIPTFARYGWYMYYIPQMLLPVFLLFSAFCLRKFENYKLPKRYNLLFIPAAIGIALVLTNDFHQLVFAFPEGVPNEGNSYEYAFMFYIIMAVCLSEIAVFFIILIKKCRFSERRKIVVLPIIPVFLIIIYGVFYVVDHNLITVVLGDMTAVNCLLSVLSLEACIYKGLIPSNTHYAQLLKASELPTVITDRTLTPVYGSEVKIDTEEHLLNRAVESGSVTEKGFRTSVYPIDNGFAFWQEDISLLVNITEELDELQYELSEQYMVQEEAYKTARKKQILIEKNRLYNMMQAETAQRVEDLSRLVEKFSLAVNEEELRPLIADIALRLAYLKRRNNLLFLKESSHSIRSEELSFCIRESLNNFMICGANAVFSTALDKEISFKTVTRIYDALETVLEEVLHKSNEIYVSLKQKDDTVSMGISLTCIADLFSLSNMGFVVDEDGENEWSLFYSVREDGDAV